ncbi:ATP-binding protein [Microbacterium sp. W1N]|uniref:AAA family ATPase n=1 Tax=Microbacterium festucae TaxID=2977531 RepID=UPI0021BFA441|nr:ATP-binding protein [Microbacterium festucae]MCT9819835.1 ATP-binding protein [Microbacterium festucae]
MNFGRVVDIDDDADEVWVEFENGNRVPLDADSVPNGAEIGDLLYVSDQEIRRAPASAVWKRALQLVARLVSIDGDRVILRVDRSPRVEELAAIEDPALDAYYFLDGDSRIWRRMTDAEASAAESAEGIDFSVNRFDIEELTPALGGRAAYGGMAEWFDRLLVALNGNFDARAIADGRDYSSGAIFFGPPGTGKTFLARSLAEEASASLITVNGPELVDRWFGSTERAMRDLFETGRTRPRAVIFIDEFDSIGPRRGPDVHEAINRQVGQLLSLTDSANRADRPFVIAATNRLEDVDEGFLRAGRFDYKVPFALPHTAEREQIVKAQAPELAVDVVRWIAAATDGLSPAQLAQVWREADHQRDSDGRTTRTLEDVLAGLDVVRAEHTTVAQAREQWERDKERP